MSKTNKIDFWRSYFRSFFIQAGWNYERMIALGFLWAIIPLTEKLYSKSEEKISFIKKHISSFNSNPYFASYAIGAIAKLEQERKTPEEITDFKQALMGPLGALGDSLVWVRFRPALGILGIMLALKFGILGGIVFFALYNIFQLHFRYVALNEGYSFGFGLAGHLSSKTYPQLIGFFSMVGAVLFGFFFIFCLNNLASFDKIGELLFFLAVFLFCVWALRKNLNPGLVFLISLFGGVGLNLLLNLVAK